MRIVAFRRLLGLRHVLGKDSRERGLQEQKQHEKETKEIGTEGNTSKCKKRHIPHFPEGVGNGAKSAFCVLCRVYNSKRPDKGSEKRKGVAMAKLLLQQLQNH